MTNDFDFEKNLRSFVEEKISDRPSVLREACEYALFGNGKRIRPLLCFLTADFCDIPREKVAPLAASIEFIHNYSLIHDDLPCMDNDDFRRGKPTVHKKYGEGIALLAGDALLNAAYEILFDLLRTDVSYTDSCKIIASYAGTNGMIGGQALEFAEKCPDYDTFLEIIKKKTGGLISASVLSVALLSHNRIQISALSQFALYLGMIFQITDDLLDMDSGESTSIVTLLGEQKAKEILRSFVDKAQKTLIPFGDKNQNLLKICQIIATRIY